MSSTTLGYSTTTFQELHTTGLYTDLVLLCGRYRWNLHRAIVHQFSPSFAASRDNNCDDGSKATITMDNEEPELLDIVVRFVYEQDYDDDDPIVQHEEDGTIIFTPSEDKDEEVSTVSDDLGDLFYVKSAEQLHSCLLVNVHIYVLADKLNIPGLKQLAVDKFKRRLDEQGHWPYYKFTEVVATILSKTTDNNDELRSTVLGLLNEHPTEVLRQHDIDESPFHEECEDWMKILREHPGFVLDLWRHNAAARAATVQLNRMLSCRSIGTGVFGGS